MPTVFIPAPFFPPSSMPPAQRIRLVVRHLHEFGWKPVIFTVDPYYREEIPDPWMLEIAGDQFEKIEVNAWDQRKTRKFGLGDLGIRMFYSLIRAILNQRGKEGKARIDSLPGTAMVHYGHGTHYKKNDRNSLCY